MQKTTIFFIGLTAVVLIITGTLLGYRFFFQSDGAEKEILALEPEVIDEQKEVEVTPIPEEEMPSESEEDEPKSNEPGESDKPIVLETDNGYPLATINKEKVTEAGFLGPDLNISPFNGTIFGTIDLSEFRDDEHLQFNLTENSEHAANLTELMFPSNEIAEEIYLSLKGKTMDEETFMVNETNQFGDLSFFANHEEDKNSVFLVVKIGSRLYTFHYPAKNHNKIKNLIGLL